jgi:transposase InsO family protein
VIDWGWFYLSAILDGVSRYIIAWKLCTTMAAGDVTDTLRLALVASGCDLAHVRHKPRLLSDNGPSTSQPVSPVGSKHAGARDQPRRTQSGETDSPQ